MGYNTARDLVSQDIPIEEQLKIHLRMNCHPQVPHEMIPLAKDSIQRYWDAHNFDKSELIYEKIGMPIVDGKQWTHRGNTYTTAYDVVDQLKLDAWLEQDDSYKWFEDDD